MFLLIAVSSMTCQQWNIIHHVVNQSLFIQMLSSMISLLETENVIYRMSQNTCNPLIWYWLFTETRNSMKADVSLCLIWILYGYNWRSFFKILCNHACERPSSWEHLRRDFFGLLPTESFTASTLSELLAVN